MTSQQSAEWSTARHGGRSGYLEKLRKGLPKRFLLIEKGNIIAGVTGRKNDVKKGLNKISPYCFKIQRGRFTEWASNS